MSRKNVRMTTAVWFFLLLPALTVSAQMKNYEPAKKQLASSIFPPASAAKVAIKSQITGEAPVQEGVTAVPVTVPQIEVRPKLRPQTQELKPSDHTPQQWIQGRLDKGTSSCVGIPAPGELTIISVGNDFVEFETVFDQLGGFVQLRDANDNVLVAGVVDTTGRVTLTISSLNPGTIYSVCVYNNCLNDFIIGPLCAQFQTQGGTDPCANVIGPSQLELLQVDKDSVEIAVSVDPSLGGYWRLDDANGVALNSGDLGFSGRGTFTLTGLAPSTSYSLCIFSNCPMEYILGPLCIAFTTSDDDPCAGLEAPSDLAITRVGDGFVEFNVSFDRFGGVAAVRDQNENVLFNLELPAGNGVYRFDQLAAGTPYELCVWNNCDGGDYIFGPACLPFTTSRPDCPVPFGLILEEVTPTTFIHQVTIGNEGGLCELYDADNNIIGAVTLDPGRQFISTGDIVLDSDTDYQVRCANFCGKGFSDVAFLDLRTLPQPEERVPPPFFLNANNFWLTKDGDLACFFEDPNADGAGDDLVYVVSLEQGCETVLGPVEVGGNDWPQTVFIEEAQLPTDYSIVVQRRNPNLSKKNDTSESVSIGAPETSSTGLLRDDRWLLHAPRIGGGFHGVIQIENTNTSKAVMALTGYDDRGNPLQSEALEIQGNQVLQYALYEPPQDLPVTDTLFEGNRDLISHIVINEVLTNRTKVSMKYFADASGLAIEAPEVKLSSGDVVGQEFLISSTIRSKTQFFDGVAVLNLTGENEAEVFLIQRDPQTDAVINETLLGRIPPMGKVLGLLNDQFPDFIPYARYTIEVRNGSGIQILGLTGTRSQDALGVINAIKRR